MATPASVGEKSSKYRLAMLIDTNIIIFALKPEYTYLLEFIAVKNPSVSAITYLEILECPELSLTDQYQFKDFFDAAHVIPISQKILEKAVELQHKKSTSTNDAIIMATALIHNLTLVTASLRDYDWLNSLKIINPIFTGA
jgi:predicted nucleic acid-binding protein